MWFRYPFLDSGPDARVHQAFVDFLEQRHYRVAHITVDYKDYSFYELPQILLIHCNELNSVTLRDSIDRMRKRGYSFVTLEDATKDPAYLRPDTFAGDGGSWLERSARAMGKKIAAPGPRMPKWITDLPRPGR